MNGNNWKEIKNFSDYKISDEGLVWSEKKKKNIILYKGKDGYFRVFLSCKNKQKIKYVHHLVLEAFFCPRPIGLICNHKDGIKTNNNINNLEWVTYKQNAQHAWDTGLEVVTDKMRENDKILGRNVGINYAFLRKGEKHGRAKLTESQIKEIKELSLTNKYFQREIAVMFNISQTQISKIILNQSWKHQK